MTTIKHIDQSSIKFIAAGEKISDIETVVRELVENSIDAGAKNIEVRLGSFGRESVEVCDDGSGIEAENFSTLGLRYHTSKIEDFTKLQESLETFGFRGEALSCLLSVASVIITTKTKSSPTGSKLTFKDGILMKAPEHVARTRGTTVIVKNLFHSLPVRRRELETTAKRQYDKVVKSIYEQALARPNIKFTLCKKGQAKKEKDFTHGGTTLEGTIITIFGIKVLDSLTPIVQCGVETKPEVIKVDLSSIDESIEGSSDCVETRRVRTRQSQAVTKEKDSEKETFLATVEPVREEFYKAKRSTKSLFRREKPEYIVHGYISKVGSGRNSTDCQFIFVNKKPCDIPKLSRLINETYRNYSANQYPFYTLFIHVQNWAADFNVPRKRAVILQEESKLCDIVRDSLEAMFSPCVPDSQRSCPVAQIPMTKLKQNGDDIVAKLAIKRELDPKESISDETVPSKKAPSSNQTYSASTMTSPDILSSTLIPNGHEGSTTPPSEYQPAKDDDNNILVDLTIDDGCETDGSGYFDPQAKLNAQSRPGSRATSSGFVLASELLHDERPQPGKSNTNLDSGGTTRMNGYQKNGLAANEPDSSTKPSTSVPVCEPVAPPRIPQPEPQPNCQAIEPRCLFKQVAEIKDGKLQVRLENLEDLHVAMQRERTQRLVTADSKEFSYAIHPQFNTVAEEELKFNLNKRSFEQMEILGQFNRGFIITRLNKHVFIIDQHATDERANFEDQLDKSPLVKQPMVRPKPLYLNSIQENAVISNIDEFKKRGFEFIVNESKSPGLRVLLSSTSICKGLGLDEYLTKEDVEELIDVITESPNNLSSYTLKKVKSVAATRACRKSVMIGDKLNWSQMTAIVTKMANLQNPWICAHNRPTIRHLMETDWMNEKLF